tara:strand:- start:144 stop:425 length:282 start_codon:yes stop_codon:yes gene_type:complete
VLHLTVDKDLLPNWRKSKFPGGCAHACELETSMYLYLDGDNVRKDEIKNGTISFNEENNPSTSPRISRIAPRTNAKTGIAILPRCPFPGDSGL